MIDKDVSPFGSNRILNSKIDKIRLKNQSMAIESVFENELSQDSKSKLSKIKASAEESKYMYLTQTVPKNHPFYVNKFLAKSKMDHKASFGIKVKP